jgi:uncharacterized protein (DUF608 family)
VRRRGGKGYQAWAKKVLGPCERTTYRGEALRAVAMPLGGLGTGSIALCGDGGLRQWQIFNQINHQAHVPHSFFAVWASVPGRGPVARVLQSGALYDQSDFRPPVTSSDHVVPEESRALLSRLPGVAEVEFVGEYPVAQVTYRDPALPVSVVLEAFSPMIPLAAKDSGLPVILFCFRVGNSGRAPCQVSLAATLQNAVGYLGLQEIRGVECREYGGNTNIPIGLAGMRGALLSSPALPDDAPGKGTMLLAALADECSVLGQWDDLATFWEDFAADGEFGTGAVGTSASGRTWNAALAVPVRLEPGEEKTVAFLIAWHFPNRCVNWGQEGFGVKDTRSRFYLGNNYANWFADALAVGEYVRDNRGRLVSETHLYRDTLYDSTLPYWLLDAVSSQTSIMRSPTVMWTGDGVFHGFEGCCGASTGGGAGGCCPMDCTHVWNYEQALAALYPDLERTMRQTDLLVQMSAEGAIPHRTVLPLYLPRWQDRGPGSDVIAADGHFGSVVKAYREYLRGGGRAFLEEAWPAVKKAMTYGMERWDGDGDGLLDGPQWNTYDLNFGGFNTFCSGFCLAALRAAEEMARIVGEGELADHYRARFEAGSAKAEALLWNGEYYEQRYHARQSPEKQYGKGCLADQMIGQWWAHLLGLGYLFRPERVRASLEAIWRHNFRRDFVGFQQQRVYASDHDKGLLICTWPRGGRPGKPMYYCDEVWTGVEYQVASHMLMEGLTEPALLIVKAARDRYDGRERSPWNEVECGDHYVRAMSSWALLEAAAGFRYSAADQRLRFAPKLTPEAFRSFFITDSAWGTIAQQAEGRRQTVTVSVAWGKLEVQTLEFRVAIPSRRVRAVEVRKGARSLRAAWQEDQGRVTIKLGRGVRVTAGDRIEARLRSG